MSPIDSRRLGAVTLPLLILMMLAVKLAPTSWLDAAALGSLAIIAVVGIWIGIKAWRWAKSENA